jgi:DNA polymerase III alpha subunit (gram-positive type)
MLLGFIDFEATDKDPLTARITQYAMSVFEDTGGWSEVWHYSGLLFDSSYPEMNETAQAITGITRDQIKKFGDSPVDRLPQFIKAMESCDYVVGHNIRRFDIPLLDKECERYGLHLPDISYIDTRFDIPYPEHIDTRKLSYLCVEHNICVSSGHSARHDVDVTARLFFRYPLDEIILLSKSPEIWVRADVSYDTKDKAKALKYSWDSVKKIWVKQLKECHLEKEKAKAEFPVIVLKDYQA